MVLKAGHTQPIVPTRLSWNCHHAMRPTKRLSMRQCNLNNLCCHFHRRQLGWHSRARAQERQRRWRRVLRRDPLMSVKLRWYYYAEVDILVVGRVRCLNSPKRSSHPPFIHERESKRGYISPIARKWKLNRLYHTEFLAKTNGAIEEISRRSDSASQNPTTI